MSVVVIVILSFLVRAPSNVVSSSQHLSSPLANDVRARQNHVAMSGLCSVICFERLEAIHKMFQKSSRSGRRSSLPQAPPSAPKLLSYSQYDLPDLLV